MPAIAPPVTTIGEVAILIPRAWLEVGKPMEKAALVGRPASIPIDVLTHFATLGVVAFVIEKFGIPIELCAAEYFATLIIFRGLLQAADLFVT